MNTDTSLHHVDSRSAGRKMCPKVAAAADAITDWLEESGGLFAA
jgi:hypothetical protein